MGSGIHAHFPLDRPPRSKSQFLKEEDYPTLEAASHLKQPVKSRKGEKPPSGVGFELKKTPVSL